MGFFDLSVIVAAAMIFLPLEHLFPLHADQKWWRRSVPTDLLHVLLSGFLIRAGGLATALVVSMAALSLVPASVREAIRSQPDWLEFAEILILSDLGFYLAHRIVHAVPWLWRFHAVHHSSEQLDWLATYRVHPVDQVFNSAVITMPALTLGFSPGPLLAYALIYRWHAILLHSNVAFSLGPLGRLIATPHYHHWHHADEAQAHDRNFGGQLVVWDRLFDTYYDEARLPERYGVNGEVGADYPSQLLEPLGIRLRQADKLPPRLQKEA